MIFKNCRIVRPTGVAKGDVFFEDGKIREVGRANAPDAMDAKGMLLFPGLVDPHVHLRDPGSPHKEDFYTGTCAALAGGFTTVMDMPEYNGPTTATQKALKEKEGIARIKAVCDYHLRFGATSDNFSEIKKAAPASIKFFTAETKSPLTITDYSLIARHFSEFPKTKPICVHAEDQDVVDKLSEQYSDHCKVRGPLASAFAVAKLLALQKVCPRRLHICHVSTGLELELLRGRSKLVTCEVAPHHLFMDTRDYKRLGSFAKMNPPLRSPADRAVMWKNIDMIDMIGTDHAPHTKEEKESDNPPSGVPGLETALPLLLDACLKGKLRITRIPKMCSLNPAKAFGMRNKGSIAPGFDADFVLVDPNETTTIRGESFFTKCKWSPFEGRELKGRIKRVFLRGEEVYSDTEGILAKPGFGKKII